MVFLLLCSSLVWGQPIPPTPFELEKKQSLPDSRTIGDYLTTLDTLSPRARLVALGTSAGGRPIQALLLSESPPFLRDFVGEPDKPTVMMFGSQHGNEPSGAEALQRLARELVAGEHPELLHRLNLVLVAMANPDGRDLRRRHNANDDNTNIDYVALQAGETRLLVEALHRFDPDVVFDAHESGIWKRVLTRELGWMTDVEAQFDVGNNPNIDGPLRDYTESKLLPELIARVSEAGLAAVRYRGEITSLDQAVSRGGLGITNLRNYAAMQGRVSILVENRLDNKGGTYATPRNIAERVRKQHLSMLAMLQLVADEAEPLLTVSRRARQQWQSAGAAGRTLWMGMSFDVNRDQPEITLPLVHFADGHQELHRFRNRDAIVTREPVTMAAAYAVTRERERVARWLASHHIAFETILEPRELLADRLEITEVRKQPEAQPGVREKVQPEVMVNREAVTLQRGDLLVPMSQPLAPLAALMLDPRSANALYQEEGWNWLQPGEFPVFPVVEY
ncbi:M14 family zinc carboxypeptidase [Oceanisphaera arctica]|uniref:M14 family zinc carboxypeptidase n=1 Tax=Oceanisphaera arctica TaxID=641510 RepID=UPI0019C6538B|nr:M14 family zinc carboxypeptidase [Oceanisphaera arctica]GHA29837.1 hypothetical protein GCM10007082_32250 [Oceanisphaera arctica]